MPCRADDLRPAAGGTVIASLAPNRSPAVGVPFPLENEMGKYFLAWLLGVPGIVLLILWFFFN